MFLKYTLGYTHASSPILLIIYHCLWEKFKLLIVASKASHQVHFYVLHVSKYYQVKINVLLFSPKAMFIFFHFQMFVLIHLPTNLSFLLFAYLPNILSSYPVRCHFLLEIFPGDHDYVISTMMGQSLLAFAQKLKYSTTLWTAVKLQVAWNWPWWKYLQHANQQIL